MANIVIVISSIQATDNGDEIDFTCCARCSGMTVRDPTVVFHAFASPSESSSVVNDIIEQTAISTLEKHGFTVEAQDQKVFIGGLGGKQ